MLEVQRRTQCVDSQPVTDEEDQSLYFKATSLQEKLTQEMKIQCLHSVASVLLGFLVKNNIFGAT